VLQPGRAGRWCCSQQPERWRGGAAGGERAGQRGGGRAASSPAASSPLLPQASPPQPPIPPPELQVLPTKGFPVAPGSSYTVRAVVADAGDADVDSLLMLVAGSLQLVQPPTAAAGGPYKAVRAPCLAAGSGENGKARKRLATRGRVKGLWLVCVCGGGIARARARQRHCSCS
jgi:hypothetical protein